MRCRVARLIVAVAAIVVCGRGIASAQTAADLFNDQVLHRIDVYIYSKDWLLLKANYLQNTHYPADLRWQGKVVRNAAVRSHGNFTRSGIKPSLHFNFDRYASGQTFLGLQSLVLKNLREDPSTLRDFLAMKMLRRLGVAAPRVAFAAVYVNNRSMGLYGLVENVDTVTAQRVFGESAGHLFEYKNVGEWGFEYLGADLAEYARHFKPVNNVYDTQEDLYRPFEAWCRLANESQPSEFSASIGRYVDVAGMMRFVAAQAFMAQYDGFTGNWRMNNLYVYRTEGTTVHRFVAWDQDLACFAVDYPITRGHEENVLVRRLMEIPDARQAYFATLLEAAGYADEVMVEAGAAMSGSARQPGSSARTTISPDDLRRFGADKTGGVRAADSRRAAGEAGPGWLESEALRALSLVRASAYLDTLKPYTNEEFEAAVAYVLEFCRQRAAFVRGEVARLADPLGSSAAAVSRR
jgi:spore coat protein CotH